MKAQQNVIHVEFKAGGNHYFGSIAALFEMFDSTTLGVSESRLYQIGLSPDVPYTNSICTIRRAPVKRKKGNRPGSHKS